MKADGLSPEIKHFSVVPVTICVYLTSRPSWLELFEGYLVKTVLIIGFQW